MKKIIIAGLITVLILLTGCTTKYVCGDGTVVSDLNMCKKQEPAPKPVVNVVTPQEDNKTATVGEIKKEIVIEIKKDIDADVQTMIDKVNTYDNYEYTYSGPALTYITDVYVLGTKIKYQFEDNTEQYLNTDEFYDTIILDTDKKLAYQYCTNQKRCSAKDREIIRQVDYDSKKISTLKDVVNTIMIAKTTGSEMVMNRDSKRVEYTDAKGVNGTIWIDKYWGVPLRKEYIIGEDKATENFYDFIKDGVTEKSMTVPNDLVSV